MTLRHPFVLPWIVLAVAALAVGCGTVEESAERPVAPAPTRPGAATTAAPVTETVAAETTVPPTTVPTSVATTVVAESVAQAVAVALREDGLGVAKFGDPADPALAALGAGLGAPTTDSGWVDAVTSPFGVCPGSQVRGVRWGPLQVLFTDQPTPSLLTYVFATAMVMPGESTGAAGGLQTPEGIGLGSSLADLQASYPGLVVTADLYGPTFSTTSLGGLAGTLSSEGVDGFVTSIVGGTFCGE